MSLKDDDHVKTETQVECQVKMEAETNWGYVSSSQEVAALVGKPPGAREK